MIYFFLKVKTKMRTDFEIANFFEDFSSKCSKVSKRSFSKGELITTYIEKRNQLCILLSGTANLIRYDFNGNKTIIGHFTKDDIFGEVLYPTNTNNELFVEAKENCEVLSFIYDIILNKCNPKCKFHEELEKKIPILIMTNTIKLNTRIELLTKKNIRDKLLTYFNILSTKNLSKTFRLPFTLTDLADYLSVDRSAMMRELSHLKQEGFIEKTGNKITLLIS